MKKPNENRFGSIIENVSDVVAVLDADGVIRYVNPAARRTLGYTSKQLLGKNIADFIHPDDLPAALEAFQHRLDHPHAPTDYFMEVRIRHKNGQWRNFEGMGNNLLDDPTVNGIVLLARDVTERKRAKSALQESERRFREMLESIQLIAVLLDLDGRVIFCNEFLLQITGYTRDEVLGCDWFTQFVPDVRPDVEEILLQGLRRGEIAAHYENPIRTKSGTDRFIRFSNTILSSSRKGN
jgi:PAS domain S-box-containing protein